MHLEGTAFLYGANSAFIEELYQRYLKDPKDVKKIRAIAAVLMLRASIGPRGYGLSRTGRED